MVQKSQPARPPVHHFGERLRASPLSFRLVRDEYALPSKKNTTWEPPGIRGEEFRQRSAWMYEDDDHRVYSDEYCRRQREFALKNFDLNMAFFSSLSGRDFLDALNGFTSQYRNLRPVSELAALDGVEGVYLMVLDRYKQVYIGQAENMRLRIKRHWAGTKQFDRLIFPDPETSVLSIDSFRALDTTRVFALKTKRRLDLEDKFVEAFPLDYLLNRVVGGARFMGSRFLLGEIKQRRLVQEADAAAVEPGY